MSFSSSTPSPNSHSLPELGSVIDGYQLTQLIGEGGMGAVYKAHKNGLNYALKLMIHPTPRAAARFDREAQSLAKVSRHGHIVTIHSYSRSSPWPYLVSELVEGMNLRQWLDTHELDFKRSLTICIEIASALDHIHRHGIWHRDLKPENILIRHSDQKSFLTDFGIAKDQESQDSLTQSGEFVGTLNYMSPEQMTGEKDKMGPQSDIWSLGVVLYQLTTGQLPFQAPSSAELMSTILFQEPEPPSSLNPKLPKGFSTLISSALQKNPQHRYPSAKDFARDCQALLAGQAVEGASSTGLGAGSPRPQRILVKALFSLGLLLILSLGLYHVLHNKNNSISKAQILKDYQRLSATRQFNESVVSALMVQSIENIAFPGQNKETESIQAELVPWIQLELTIQKYAKNDLFKDEQLQQYKSLRKRLNPLYFLQGFPALTQDPDGLLSQRWQRILQLTRQLKDKPEFAKQQLNNLGNADYAESGFALFLLGLTQVKDERWEDAEQSLLSLQSNERVSLRRASKKYLQRVYQGLLVNLVLTKAQGRKDIQRVIRQMKNFAKDERAYREQLKGVQSRLEKHFQELRDPKAFAAGEQSYLLLEQICGQIPLRRPLSSPAFHLYMASKAHALKQTSRALFHHYQRLKNDMNAKLPREYRRYVFQDTIRLNMQVIHKSNDQSLRAAADAILEISRAGFFFDEILLNSEINQLEETSNFFTRCCQERPYDPYPRYWRLVANIKHLFPLDKKERQRRIELVKADKDFVVQSSFSSPIFKAMVLLNYCEYRLRIYEQIINSRLPMALEQELIRLLKDAESFQIPELDKFYSMKCRVFQLQRKDLIDKSAPESELRKNAELLIPLIQSYLKALKDRWQWSQQPSHKISSSSPRLRLSLRSYQYKICHQGRELARVYRQNGQAEQALETLLTYRAFALQNHTHSIEYLEELIHLKLWPRAHAFLKAMPFEGYGPKSQERYMKLKAFLSQYK